MSVFEPKHYWESRLQANYTLQGVGDITYSLEFNDFMYRVRRRVFRSVVRSLECDVRQAKVADVGCGTGVYVEEWSRQGVGDLVGFDITEKAVAELSSRFPKYRFNVLDIGLEKELVETPRLDIVSCFDVLYHIVDDKNYQTAFNNISSMLKPGGYFLLSEDFLRSKRLTMKHQVCRTLDEISDVAEKAGFEIVSRRPVFMLMNDPVDGGWLIKRIFPRLMRLAQMKFIGPLLTRAIYATELMLLTFAQEGPSTEIMVCRKK